jgi:hypothetical protein
LEKGICQSITRERLQKAAEGYIFETAKKKKIQIDGLGGGFRYVTLGISLFDEAGNIRKEVSFADLAAHVFFTETGEPLPKPAASKSPLLGIQSGVAVYLLYNGVLGDKRVNGGNILIGPVLDSLPTHDGPRVIYGEGCRLSAARLKREGVTFRQIPYQIKVG